MNTVCGWRLLSKSVKQVFRWIEPGTFLMGFPTDEPERYDDERQHSVKLNLGYWLADTIVTQSLWKAFMEDNPSHFTGDATNALLNKLAGKMRRILSPKSIA